MTEDIFDGLDPTCKCLENRLNKGFPQLTQTKQKQNIKHTFELLCEGSSTGRPHPLGTPGIMGKIRIVRNV